MSSTLGGVDGGWQSHNRLLLRVLLVFALAAAACGGSSSPDDAAVAEAEAAAAALSPMESSLGFPSEPGRRQYELLTRQRAADEALTQCMEDAGFFYVVAPAEDLLRGGAYVGDGSRAWTTQNGLGIATAYLDALKTESSRQAPDAQQANQAFVDSLTPEQADAYDLALVGDLSASAQTTEFAPAGCWGQSYTELLKLIALVDVFEPELASLNDRLVGDPRVRDIEASWSECMTEAGYRYADQQAMVDDVYAQLLEIELADVNGSAQIASPEAADLVIGFEREVALASFDCRDGLTDALNELRGDYEQEFLDDNRFKIAELRPDS